MVAVAKSVYLPRPPSSTGDGGAGGHEQEDDPRADRRGSIGGALERAAAPTGDLASEVAALPLPPHLEIRVGIHTGPLAASTVGFIRNSLTMIGDTLNAASRMETLSRPGNVRITQVKGGVVG